MSTIPEVKAKLLGTGFFKLVGGGLEFASVKDMPLATPAAYVLSMKDASAPYQVATGPIRQRTERDLVVVTILRDLADKRGAATDDQLEATKTLVRSQLIGFVPTDMEEPISHVGGEVVQAVAGTVWFEDTFSAPIYTRETP